MSPRVYLAGPISGMRYSDAVDWRQWAQAWLRSNGIAAYSPMRAKEFIAQMAQNGQLPTLVTDHENPLATSKGIMCRDHTDCTRADALLVNFAGVTRVSLGTAMELAWAYDRHIPVVVVSEADNPNIAHPMAREAVDYRVDTLEQGVRMIQTIVLPEGI